MLFFYEPLSALALLLVILCKLIYLLSFVCTRIRNLLCCILYYCNRTRSSLRLNELIVIEESCFFTWSCSCLVCSSWSLLFYSSACSLQKANSFSSALRWAFSSRYLRASDPLLLCLFLLGVVTHFSSDSSVWLICVLLCFTPGFHSLISHL